jgi:hypothetical protein
MAVRIVGREATIAACSSSSSNLSRPNPDDEMPLTEKLRRILMLKVEEAETDKDRERAERELAKFNSPSSEPQ